MTSFSSFPPTPTSTRRSTPASSRFASSAEAETALTVLAVATRPQAEVEDMIELEIGGSPLAAPEAAAAAGTCDIGEGRTRHGPPARPDDFREAAATYVSRRHSRDA